MSSQWQLYKQRGSCSQEIRAFSPDLIEISSGHCVDPTMIPPITGASIAKGRNDQRAQEHAAAEGGSFPPSVRTVVRPPALCIRLVPR